MKTFKLNEKEVEIVRDALEMEVIQQTQYLDAEISSMDNQSREKEIGELEDVKQVAKKFK